MLSEPQTEGKRSGNRSKSNVIILLKHATKVTTKEKGKQQVSLEQMKQEQKISFWASKINEKLQLKNWGATVVVFFKGTISSKYKYKLYFY